MGFPELQQAPQFKALFENTGEIHIEKVIEGVRHVLSHQVIHTNFYRIRIERKSDLLKQYRAIEIDQLEKYAIPRLIHKQLEKLTS